LHASQVTAPQCHPLDGSPQTLHGSKRSSLTNNPMLVSSAILTVAVYIFIDQYADYFVIVFQVKLLNQIKSKIDELSSILFSQML
jgi:hypothetical protein